MHTQIIYLLGFQEIKHHIESQREFHKLLMRKAALEERMKVKDRVI